MVPPAMDPAAERDGLLQFLFSQFTAIIRSFHWDGLYNTGVNRFYALVLILALPVVARAEVQPPAVQESTSTIEPEQDPTTSTQESESKDVIPRAAEVLSSTMPITPVSAFPEKKPYDQALEELARAKELWAKGHPEAASDSALEAYDDLIDIRRVPGVKRSVIRAQIHEAADIYVRGGIAYVQGYVRRGGSRSEVREEGRARLEDLRDVARNYPELNKLLNNAIEQLH
jgi:hypothetical protein